MVTIGITTFRERFESHLKPLVRQLKGHPAIIAVNAHNHDGLDDNYRKEMMRFLAEHDNVSAIFYQQMRGCAKMWNDLVVHSPTEDVLILNDDVHIESIEYLMGDVDSAIKAFDGKPIFVLNGSWSHFLTSKRRMIDIGWFDERLLGFGEEDGDMVFRYIEKYGQYPMFLKTLFIKNISSDIRDESVKKGVLKYTAFNRQFMGFADNAKFGKYKSDRTGIKGMFHEPMRNLIPNAIQYPYEEFFMNNRENL